MLTIALAVAAAIASAFAASKFLRKRTEAAVASARQDAAAAVDRLAQNIAGQPKP
jgi:hypothetical protein